MRPCFIESGRYIRLSYSVHLVPTIILYQDGTLRAVLYSRKTSFVVAVQLAHWSNPFWETLKTSQTDSQLPIGASCQQHRRRRLDRCPRTMEECRKEYLKCIGAKKVISTSSILFSRNSICWNCTPHREEWVSRIFLTVFADMFSVNISGGINWMHG